MTREENFLLQWYKRFYTGLYVYKTRVHVRYSAYLKSQGYLFIRLVFTSGIQRT